MAATLLAPVLTAFLVMMLAAPAGAATTQTTQMPNPASELMARLALQQGHLIAPAGASGDQFGYAVALSGDTALVGAPYSSPFGHENQGAAYFFVRSGGSWSLQQFLYAGDGVADDCFGSSVALSGDTALVGAPSRDVANADQGAAYVFTRSGTVWTHQQTLTGSGGAAAGDEFGSSVALSGDTALVGAPYGDPFGHSSQGGAYVFVRSGTSWSQQRYLYDGDGVDNDWFGHSVALSGETALVGAPQRDVAGSSDQGAAYVFTRSGTAWTHQQTLTGSDGAEGDQFGSSVALSGETALVGAPYDDVGGPYDQGSACVFTRSGGAWAPQQLLLPADGASVDYFGHSVALSGDMALVGAKCDTVGTNEDQGSAHFFTRSGSVWTPQPMLTADDGAASDQFGCSVALSGTTTLVGARWGNMSLGSAYVFQLDTTRPTTTAYAAAVRKSRKVKLAYKVSDAAPSCGQATVTLKIYKGKRLKKTLRPGVRACNVKQRYSWRCTLAKGRYTVKVYAKDAAGNAQSKVGRARLTVK